VIIGFTNGCFDVFHPGHEHYLRRCQAQCEYLIVALNSDAYIARVKGAERPIWTWGRRMKFVRTLCNAVIPFEGRWEQLVMEIRPNVVFQGEEYRPKDALEVVLGARKVGWKYGNGVDVIPIIYIARLPGYSTSAQVMRLHTLPGQGKTAP